METFPPEIQVEPWTGPPPRATVRLPGSKSLTNRALILAAVAEGPSLLTGALHSEDTQVMLDALRALGVSVVFDVGSAEIRVEGTGGVFPVTEADLWVANSGTTLRFLTAMLATGRGQYRIDGSPRMRERPVADLLAALNRLGGRARSDLGTGCPPLSLQASGLDGGHVSVRGDVSSQFLSGLLMALPLAHQPTTVEVQGKLVSQPYVAMTLAAMEAFGVRVGNRGFRRFDVRPARYHGRHYPIEPDASAASYFFALAAITGGEITVEGLGRSSIQGDLAFVEVLQHMGCSVTAGANRTTVQGGRLVAVDVDMNAISDTVMTLAVTSLFADGVTRIRNVAHIRHKETDRISALACELRKLGAQVVELPDGLVIHPPSPAGLQAARIETYQDHRMAMAFALAGLRVPGITILDPGCVAKTYPSFWADLEALRASRT